MLVKKNIKSAIKILDYLIEAHTRNSKGIRDMIKNWTSDSRGLGDTIADTHDDVAKCLVLVKECIEEKPKCKHPKKMRDKTSDGKWYCMNCNEDLLE